MRKSKILGPHQNRCVKKSLVVDIGQFCYPTGTGKTISEAHIFIEHIIGQGGFGVYSVLAPRIMLAAQLFEEMHYEIVVSKGIKAVFFSLHSGKAANMSKIMAKTFADDDRDDEQDMAQVSNLLRNAGIDISAENFGSGVSAEKLLVAYERAKELDVPLIICSTYHSSHLLGNPKLIEAGFHIDVLIADEGHNAVAVGFSHIHDLPATKRFYFTATLKFTDGELGMNNTMKFGPLLDSMSLREAVAFAPILRPRMHFVRTEVPVGNNELDADCKAITSGFQEHAKLCKIGAKMLVVSRGVRHIREMCVQSDNFGQLRASRPGLMIFEITSMHGPMINGEKHTREEFLESLQGLSQETEAIIIHYDILSEGIDVPGITGIMPLRSLGISKFLQTYGRTARLNKIDRENLAAGKFGPDDLDKFLKPYGWIILPDYGQFGGEITTSIRDTYVPAMRDFGFIASEDVVITEEVGEAEEEVIDELNKPERKYRGGTEYLESMLHEFEEEERYKKAEYKMEELSEEELMAFL